MITDAELYELERLFISKYENFDFNKVIFDNANKRVLLQNDQLSDLITMYYKDRSVDDEGINSISFDLFKILQLRYFRNNRTVQFED